MAQYNVRTSLCIEDFFHIKPANFLLMNLCLTPSADPAHGKVAALRSPDGHMIGLYEPSI